jgi:hypothetical protein
MVDDYLLQPGYFEMNTTMKFYLFALFIALLAFGVTRFIMRDRQASAAAAPAKLTGSKKSFSTAPMPPFSWPTRPA